MLANLFELRRKVLVRDDPIHAEFAVDHVDVRVRQRPRAHLLQKLQQRRPRLLVARAPVIQRNRLVPRVALDRELVVAAPDLLADERTNARSRRVVLEARAFAARQQPAPLAERVGRQRNAAIVLRTRIPELAPQRVVGVARDDVVRAAELRQRDLDAGTGGLARADENEPVSMRDDHVGNRTGDCIAPPTAGCTRTLLRTRGRSRHSACSRRRAVPTIRSRRCRAATTNGTDRTLRARA